jgi:multiple sugar transport system permease protein
MNMERYIDTKTYLESSLNELENKGNADVKNAVSEVRAEYMDVVSKIDSIPSVQKNYDEIEELLMGFGNQIPEDIRYASIDKESYEEFSVIIADMRTKIDKIKNSGNVKSEAVTAVHLIDELSDSVIEPNFVGLDNYIRMFSTARMYKSIWNTVFFTFGSVGMEFLLGLVVALIINKEFKGQGLFRAAVLIPWAIPTAISAMLWRFMYDGENGILSMVFDKIGIIPDQGSLLTTVGGAMFAVIFSDVWKTTPYMALLLYAGLKQIPIALYEAADVDGASKIQQFFNITLPLLKPSILVALLFRTLDAFRVFDLIYVLTGGGPANGTESISIYAYKTMFSQMRFGMGSALSFITFILIAIISTLYIKVLGADISD